MTAQYSNIFKKTLFFDTRQQFAVFFILAFALSLSTNIAATDAVYRVVNEDGSVSYTDTPPTSATADNVSTLTIDQNTNVSESLKTIDDKSPDWIKASREQRDKQKKMERDQSADALDQWQKRLKLAKDAVKKAEKDLERGKTVREGDFIGYGATSGAARARPSAEYIERIETLERTLNDANETLRTVKKERPGLITR